jgi:5-methylcytosine-specific restriction endonuclease McrA
MDKVKQRYINKKFGKLLVLKFVEYRKDEVLKNGKIKKAAFYLCKCDCGNEKIIKGKFLSNKDTKSCGCLQPEITIKRNIEKTKEKSHFSKLYNAYKGRAKYKLIPFEIDKEHFKIITSSNCYYCGIEPLQKSAKSAYKYKIPKEEYFYNGIDRINSKKGYTLDNIRPCCEICNKAKRDMSEIKFKDWINRLIQFNLKLNNEYKRDK